MSFNCPICNTDCTPTGTNVMGVGVESHSLEKGWILDSEIFNTPCLARLELTEMKKTTTSELRIFEQYTPYIKK